MRRDAAESPNRFRRTTRCSVWQRSWVNRQRRGATMTASLLSFGPSFGTGDAFAAEFYLATANREQRLPFLLSLARRDASGDVCGFIAYVGAIWRRALRALVERAALRLSAARTSPISPHDRKRRRLP